MKVDPTGSVLCRRSHPSALHLHWALLDLPDRRPGPGACQGVQWRQNANFVHICPSQHLGETRSIFLIVSATEPQLLSSNGPGTLQSLLRRSAGYPRYYPGFCGRKKCCLVQPTEGLNPALDRLLQHMPVHRRYCLLRPFLICVIRTTDPSDRQQAHLIDSGTVLIEQAFRL